MQLVLRANESDADLGSDVHTEERDLIGTVPSNDFRHMPHMPDKGAKKNIVTSVPVPRHRLFVDRNKDKAAAKKAAQ
jgi:DNA excision repair protein ERCC-3